MLHPMMASLLDETARKAFGLRLKARLCPVKWCKLSGGVGGDFERGKSEVHHQECGTIEWTHSIERRPPERAVAVTHS